jgi:glycosyltransferase involved in cell wall biosynthesis
VRILLSVDPEIPVPPKLYGGIERVADALISELRTRNHVVGLIAHPESECATDFFRPWPALRSGGGGNIIKNSVASLDAVRIFKPNVIHSFSRLAYLLPLLPSRLPKIMSYQRHTGGRRHTIATKLGGRSIAFTACSEFIARQGRHWGGNWSVIPNFVDTTRYKFGANVASDAPLIFLSRVERIKGAHTAIQIAKKSGRRLIVAGNRVEQGDGNLYWQNEIAPHLGRDGIEYVGPVDDTQKSELLSRGAALLVPIEWDEPFGIVFVEAMACGTPVISSLRGALPEIVEDGRSGLLINNVDEGVTAVQKLATISRAACREHAENCFSARVVTSRYERLYEQMIGWGK